jgi:ElaB/YqjD/DUF883 family membrane-anchored ribosome-binding protein
MADLMEKFEKSATVEDILRDLSRIKSVVADAVDDGVRSAVRKIKQGRDVADDAIFDAKRAVRQNPLQSMGIVFAAGVMTGALAAWLGSRRNSY